MRAWFWTLVLAVLAVALALVLREHAGNIVLVVPPWRIEMSLALAVVLALALVLVVHWLLRLVTWFVRAAGRAQMRAIPPCSNRPGATSCKGRPGAPKKPWLSFWRAPRPRNARS